MMNRRRPDRLAGAGLAGAGLAGRPAAGGWARAPEEPAAGVGSLADAGAVIARDAVSASSVRDLGVIGHVRKIAPQSKLTERFGHFSLT